MDSDSYQFDFSAIASPQLKGSLSDSFLPSHTSPDAFSSRRQNSNRRTSVSPTNDPWQSVPKTDPWQSAPKTNVTDVPDGGLLFTSSPVKDSAWVPFNTSVTPGMQQQHVTLDPWSSNANNRKSGNSAPKVKSTNPWASDVSEVNIAQSVAPTKTANANLQNDAFMFDPLKFDWTKDDEPTQLKQDASDLFGNWDTAVKQMHQFPSNGAPHMYNVWSQQNQMISTAPQTFTTPSLI